jgi:DNA-binding transcriptional ArsR family regulator
MVEAETPRLNAIFHALGDPTRRDMIRDLATGGRTVGDLAAPHDISLAAAHDWLDSYRRFWTGRLDILEGSLRQEDKTPKPDPEGDET